MCNKVVQIAVGDNLLIALTEDGSLHYASLQGMELSPYLGGKYPPSVCWKPFVGPTEYYQRHGGKSHEASA
jgi:hypothetical protein